MLAALHERVAGCTVPTLLLSLLRTCYLQFSCTGGSARGFLQDLIISSLVVLTSGQGTHAFVMEVDARYIINRLPAVPQEWAGQ